MTPDPDPNATLATIVETRTPKGPLKGEFYLRCCGALYESGRDVADVAKLVRADLARLAKGGVLPDGFKASVRISRYSMGCSLAIAIASAGAAQVIDAEKWIEMEAGNWNGSWGGRRYSAEGKRLLEVAEHIGRQYQRQESDSHTDYHNTNFHLQVDFESALCHAQLEAAKAAADSAAKAPAGVIDFPSRVIPVPAEEAEGDGSPSEMFLYLPTHPGEHGARHVGEDNFGTPIYERPDSTRFTVTYTPKGKVLIFPC